MTLLSQLSPTQVSTMLKLLTLVICDLLSSKIDAFRILCLDILV